ncbi:hypothetical protein [Saccharomonospora cyanea]|uniref:Uncharacterized protein n=1 Tax=Saccharomonospora cyanea NA-134 TaxID=882082 RepID=H5XK84_9PSEU|nr:hypothetical protein [Saccharomonospora cyanea]EHR63519.1 hypothetical protein SaccyDRAFT_4713 [Saccharomonospora cyanea NA-134]
MVDADGTQAPEPPKPFSDPLGGSAERGSADDAPSADAAGGTAKPVEVDREAVRQLASALAAESAAANAGPNSGTNPGADQAADDEPTAEIPPQRPPAVRASKPTLLAPILRRRRPAGGQAPRTRRATPQVRKPSSGSAGLAVALTLMVIFVLVAIQFVASFVESVTGIFN